MRLANKRINVARNIKTRTSDALKASETQLVNVRTIEAYKELAVRFSKKAELTKDQKDLIKGRLEENTGKKTKKRISPECKKRKIGTSNLKKFRCSGPR